MLHGGNLSANDDIYRAMTGIKWLATRLIIRATD